MNNQSCGCTNPFMNNGCHCQTRPISSCQCQSMPMMNNQSCGCNINGCPRPQPIVADKKVCVSQQVTPVPQPVICPIECRRVNRCMYYPVYYPQYEQTFVNMPY